MFNKFAPIATLPNVGLTPNPPAAWYPLDGPHAAGSTADVRNLAPGGGAAGTRVGGCTWGVSPGGPCLTFDGATGYVTLPAMPTIGGAGTSYTAAISFRTTQTAFSGLVSAFDGSSPNRSPFEFLFSDFVSKKLSFELLSTVNPQVTTAAFVNDGAWHRAVGVRVAGTITFYLDGISQGSASFTDVNCTATAPVQLGRYSAGGYFQGDLRGFLVDARAWSAADVLADLRDPNARRRVPPVAAWLAAATGRGGFRRVGMDGGMPTLTGGTG